MRYDGLGGTCRRSAQYGEENLRFLSGVILNGHRVGEFSLGGLFRSDLSFTLNVISSPGWVTPGNWMVAIGTSPSAGGCRAPMSEIISHCADFQIKRGSADVASFQLLLLLFLKEGYL